MEGWAEIWGIPEVIFPLKMARNKEELEYMSTLTFEAEIRGPDSTKLGEAARVILRDDCHEICFQPEETGNHMIQVKANGKNFCPPIRVEVLDDGTVVQIKERRVTRSNDDAISQTSIRRPSNSAPTSPSDDRGDDDDDDDVDDDVDNGNDGRRVRKGSTSSSLIQGPTGELFVEMDGRLVRLEEAEMEREAKAEEIEPARKLSRESRERKQSLGQSIAAFFRRKKPSHENFGKPKCHLCDSFTKLKRIMVLEKQTYCKTCFERLFMCKGPQDHLEGLQPRPENDKIGPRGRKYSVGAAQSTKKYSDHPVANLTGLKIKEVQFAQTQYRKFDSERTGFIETRYMYDILKKTLRFRLSESKVAATLQSQRLGQAMYHCGLDQSSNVTELEFLNILAFIMREKTTSWLSENMLKTVQSASAPNLLERTRSESVFTSSSLATKNKGVSRTSSSRSSKSYSSYKHATKLDTIPSMDDLDSIVDSEPDGAAASKSSIGFSNTTADSWMMY